MSCLAAKAHGPVYDPSFWTKDTIPTLQPLLATVMGLTLLGEHITQSVVAGGAVIFLGVLLAERP